MPAVAVAKNQHTHYVYVLKDTAQTGVASVHMREVEIGELSAAGLLITKGLSTGDRVVTAAISTIRAGQHVRINGG